MTAGLSATRATILYFTKFAAPMPNTCITVYPNVQRCSSETDFLQHNRYLIMSNNYAFYCYFYYSNRNFFTTCTTGFGLVIMDLNLITTEVNNNTYAVYRGVGISPKRPGQVYFGINFKFCYWVERKE